VTASTVGRNTIKPAKKTVYNVVSAVTARARLGAILKRAESDERFLVDHRGDPVAIIMGVRDYLRNVAPAPAAFRAIREDARRKGTSVLTARDIEREIAAVRRDKAKRKNKKPAA
jgi:prevent-host-death family protein